MDTEESDRVKIEALMKQQHVHFIGMCGTAMAPVAKMFSDLGWKVTGSDRGVYPPMSDYLAENNISLTVGWHPELIGNPDLVVVGYAVTLSNPELQYVKKYGLQAISYPEALGEYLVKKESIVVVGTAGKTSISGLLSWIFETAGRHPSFMSAGIQKNFSDGVRTTDSVWSILEGDEPFASQDTRRSKFFFYKPKYVILTGAEWDHKDMFPTQESYIENFVEFLKLLPSDGLIVANQDGENVEEVIERYSENVQAQTTRIVWYGEGNENQGSPSTSQSLRSGSNDLFPERNVVESKGVQYSFSNIHILQDGKVKFNIYRNEELLGEFTSNLIGKYNAENATAAIVMAFETGVPVQDIQRGLATFLGIKRRMDVRFDDGKRMVIDDFAHNAMKFKNAIEALRLHFSKEKLVVVAEPNIGSRTKESLPLFKDVFKGVDLLLLPEFSVTTLSDVISAEDVNRMVKDDTKAVVIPDDEELVSRAVEEIRDSGIICFMGSHGFRGMIEMAINRIVNYESGMKDR